MACSKVVQKSGVPSYDGQFLLLFDFEYEPYIRDPESQTEQAYVDKEKQIASFIRSGERLVNFRRADFDYPDGDVPEDANPDPTLALGFDLADASILQNKLAAKKAAAVAAEKSAEGVAGETAESVPPTSE